MKAEIKCFPHITVSLNRLRYSLCLFFLSLSLSKWGSIFKLSDFSGFNTLAISVGVDLTMLNQLLFGLRLID
ncbi:hypothetical protein ACOSQ3_033121 [Xanthoceras sorbifolium]